MIIINKFFKTVKLLTSPVTAELPFFVLFLLAISFQSFWFFISSLIDGNVGQVWSQFLFENFPRSVAISYIFTLLVHCSHSKLVRIICYAFAVILFAVCLFLRCVFGKTMQPDIIMLIAETNGKESSEFFSAFLLSVGGIVTLACVAVYISLVLFFERFKSRVLLVGGGRIRSLLLCVFVLLGLVQTLRFYRGIAVADDIEKTNWVGLDARDSVSALFFSLYSVLHIDQQVKNAVTLSLESEVPPQSFESDSLNVIYVIGESYVKRHSHLYGYALPTTPYLDEERRRGNLFVFDDVVAPSTFTSIVMKNTLCCNSLRNNEAWWDSPYFPTLFKKAGYEVFSWDNQLVAGSQEFYNFTLQSFMYNQRLSEVTYTQVSDTLFPYDGQLVEDYAEKSVHRTSHQLVMFHLYGQHMYAVYRYPHVKSFEKFTAKDIKRNEPYLDDDKRQIIAEYDNATLYNDYVMKQIIDLYRDKNTVLIYFSDHGEEIYDYRDFYGRGGFDAETQQEGLRCQYDVPFMIWCSDKYMDGNPDIVQNIRQSLHKPFRTDDICQVVFHLARLKTDYYRPKYDLLSPEYEEYKRTVNGMVYDDKK